MFFRFQIKEGRMEGFNREFFRSHIQRCTPGRYVMTIEKDYPTRSGQENRYYWFILEIIGNDTGYTKEECHAIFGEMFLSYEKHGRKFARSSAKLKTIEFEDYLEKIRRFAATDLGMYLPLPGESIDVKRI